MYVIDMMVMGCRNLNWAKNRNGDPPFRLNLHGTDSASSPILAGGTSSIGCFASCPSIELLSQQGASPAGHSLQGTLPCLLAAATGSTSPTAMAAMAGASPLILSATPALVPSHDLRPFYLSENLSDIILVVGDAALPAHRLVLAVSPRFCEVRATLQGLLCMIPRCSLAACEVRANASSVQQHVGTVGVLTRGFCGQAEQGVT